MCSCQGMSENLKRVLILQVDASRPDLVTSSHSLPPQPVHTSQPFTASPADANGGAQDVPSPFSRNLKMQSPINFLTSSSSSAIPSLTSPSVMASPERLPVNGNFQSPISVSVEPAPSPVVRTPKIEIKHEDITDDEVTVKSEPRSLEDFKYDAKAVVHEDITDDEAEATIVEPKVENDLVKTEVTEEFEEGEHKTETFENGDSQTNQTVKLEADEEKIEEAEKPEGELSAPAAATVDETSSEAIAAPISTEVTKGKKGLLLFFLLSAYIVRVISSSVYVYNCH